jgi:hypothetical protein
VFHTQIDRVLQWLSEKGAMAILIVGIAVVLYIAFKWVERYLFIRAMRMARIQPDELRALRQSNTPLIILDARSSTGRKIDPRHIPGAIAVDVMASEQDVGDVTPEHHIIVYCS